MNKRDWSKYYPGPEDTRELRKKEILRIIAEFNGEATLEEIHRNMKVAKLSKLCDLCRWIKKNMPDVPVKYLGRRLSQNEVDRRLKILDETRNKDGSINFHAAGRVIGVDIKCWIKGYKYKTRLASEQRARLEGMIKEMKDRRGYGKGITGNRTNPIESSNSPPEGLEPN